MIPGGSGQWLADIIGYVLQICYLFMSNDLRVYKVAKGNLAKHRKHAVIRCWSILLLLIMGSFNLI